MVFLETNAFSARVAYLAIVVRVKITISALPNGYLLENESLGKWRSNLSVVKTELIFPGWYSESKDGHTGGISQQENHPFMFPHLFLPCFNDIKAR